MDEKRILKSITGDFKKLTDIVGIEKAIAISNAFGGLAIAIPRLTRLRKEDRDKSIREEYDEGVPVRRLSLKYGLTPRHIYTILGRPQ